MKGVLALRGVVVSFGTSVIPKVHLQKVCLFLFRVFFCVNTISGCVMRRNGLLLSMETRKVSIVGSPPSCLPPPSRLTFLLQPRHSMALKKIYVALTIPWHLSLTPFRSHNQLLLKACQAHRHVFPWEISMCVGRGGPHFQGICTSTLASAF